MTAFLSLDSPELFLNISAPFSGVICGVQVRGQILTEDLNVS